MAKKKGLFINRETLEKIILDFAEIQNVEVLNLANKQTRYTLIKADVVFFLDVYFRLDNTLTVTPINHIGNSELSIDLRNFINDSVDNQDVVRGHFSINMSSERYEDLITYLISLDNVQCVSRNNHGVNGVVSKFKTNFGDAVTLTYYETSKSMLYQGFLMKLYAIIREFTAPFSTNDNLNLVQFTSNQGSIDNKINSHIKSNLPNGYVNLEPIMAGFIRDSFTMVVVGTNLSDYAAWVMPAMRVLEHRIKDILLNYGYTIEDTKGFKYYNANGRLEWLFVQSNGNVTVTGNISTSLGQNVCDILLKCYNYLKANRHELFHTTQIVQGTRLVSDQAQALTLINGACALIEESLTYNVAPTT